MHPLSEILGVLHPVGGGDPIPLTKPEMVIGRRPAVISVSTTKTFPANIARSGS